MLTQAMGQEVRYSRFLNDLSLTVPENVWLKSVTFTQAAQAAAAADGRGHARASAPSPSAASASSTTTSRSGWSPWPTQKGYANPYFSSSVESLLGNRKIVTFSSTTTLTPEAYSGAYSKPAGR